MANMHAHTWNKIPIALVRKGNAIQALTTSRVEVGELVVPLFFRKQSSMVMENEAVIANSKAVKILAAWALAPSQQEVDCVMEDNSVETHVHVLPELKLPKANAKGKD